MRAFPLRRSVLLLAAGSLLCLVTAATAEQAAPTPGPASAERKPDASDGAVPAVSPALKPMPRAPLALRTPQALRAGDKGSTFTDGGSGEAATAPTEHERMKLERARQAVEASRAAGLLFGARLPVPSLVFPPADLEAAKFRAMEQWQAAPRTIEHHPAAGVGDVQAPARLRGPEGLNAVEQQKLDALLRGEAFVQPAPPAAKPRVEPAKVDAGRKDRKEGE